MHDHNATRSTFIRLAHTQHMHIKLISSFTCNGRVVSLYLFNFLPNCVRIHSNNFSPFFALHSHSVRLILIYYLFEIALAEENTRNDRESPVDCRFLRDNVPAHSMSSDESSVCLPNRAVMYTQLTFGCREKERGGGTILVDRKTHHTYQRTAHAPIPKPSSSYNVPNSTPSIDV